MSNVPATNTLFAIFFQLIYIFSNIDNKLIFNKYIYERLYIYYGIAEF